MSQFSIQFDENKEVWDKLVKESPQGTVFLLSDFLDSLSVPYQLITCQKDKQVVAGMPIFFDSANQIKDTFNYFMLYQGLILADHSKLRNSSRISLEFQAMTFLIEEVARKHNGCFVSNSWKLNDLRPFQWFNYHEPEKGMFTNTLRYTGIINLDDYEDYADYFNKLGQLRKREEKKASNVSFEVTDDIDKFIELHNITYERQGIKCPDLNGDYRRSLLSGCIKNGFGKLMSAVTEEGNLASMMFFLFDEDTAYYLFGANDPDQRQSGASTSLMLQFIKEAFEKNLKGVDFCGINSPNRGEYKISFNAEPKPYFMSVLNQGSNR